MKISKNELKKISRKFRTLASNVMNSHFREQNDSLQEFLDFIEETPLLSEYLETLAFDIDELESTLEEVYDSYGTITLKLGSNGREKAYRLYQTFLCIVNKNWDTYTFGWYYASSNKYQDMAKAFGDRMIYPFVSEIENYMKDIATDMGYDNQNTIFNVNVNASGTQVNVVDNGGTVNAEQVNHFNTDKIDKAIESIESSIAKIEDENSKLVLNQNLETLKKEVRESTPKLSILATCLKSMQFIATSIAALPDLSAGIQMIASINVPPLPLDMFHNFF